MSAEVPTGSPSRGGDVAVYVFGINQPSLPIPFYSVLVSVSVCMSLSSAFHFINSPDKAPLSHSCLLVLLLPFWSVQQYRLPLYESLRQPRYNPLWLTGLKAPVNLTCSQKMIIVKYRFVKVLFIRYEDFHSP